MNEFQDEIDKSHFHIMANFRLGVAFEGRNQYDDAVDHYFKAVGLIDNDTPAEVVFWLFNNLGFSLNRTGQYAKAEQYCLAAIAVNPDLPNGFKNLGISLEGQSRYEESAQAYITATELYPADQRAYMLLRELILRKGHAFKKNEQIHEDFAVCTNLVAIDLVESCQEHQAGSA